MDQGYMYITLHSLLSLPSVYPPLSWTRINRDPLLYILTRLAWVYLFLITPLQLSPRGITVLR